MEPNWGKSSALLHFVKELLVDAVLAAKVVSDLGRTSVGRELNPCVVPRFALLGAEPLGFIIVLIEVQEARAQKTGGHAARKCLPTVCTRFCAMGTSGFGSVTGVAHVLQA